MYEGIKAAHLISVISWMVGFLYLPRLMVYPQESDIGSEKSETFKVMERRLLKGIMTPAMIASWLFGLWLMVLTEAWTQCWFISKLFMVCLLMFFHIVAVKWVREFDADQRHRSQRFYRVVNEMPAVLMVIIVILVIVKPF